MFCIQCREGLEKRVLTWQYPNGCHFVPHLMYIYAGAKFEQHPSDSFRDTPNFGVY